MNEQAARELCAGLRRLVPAGVAVAATAARQSRRSLTPSEYRTTSGMAPRRLLEFTAGRTCAHEALELLGVKSRGVPVGPRREPLWPTGIVGSISHSGELAVATVAPMTLLRSIGVDIEPATPLDTELQARICRPAELTRLRSSPDAALRAKIVFSAKESVFKCLWPLTRQFLEFSDVEVLLGDGCESFTVIGQDDLQKAACAALAGRIATAAGHIITVAYVAVEGSGSPAISP